MQAEISHPKTALITGASSGIGYELAKLFARERYRLILVARDSARLEKAASELRKIDQCDVRTIEADLASQDGVARVTKGIDALGWPIDTLINNAGFGAFGEFVTNVSSEQQNMIATNVAALTTLTRHVLPGMIARKRGYIMQVASTAAFQPGPLMAVYYATKAYVLSLSQAIDREVRPHGVVVIALCPGPTWTGFQDRAGIRETRLLKMSSVMSAEEVAKVGYRGFFGRKRVVVPGFMNKLLVFSQRFLPRSVVVSIAHWIQSKR